MGRVQASISGFPSFVCYADNSSQGSRSKWTKPTYHRRCHLSSASLAEACGFVTGDTCTGSAIRSKKRPLKIAGIIVKPVLCKRRSHVASTGTLLLNTPYASQCKERYDATSKSGTQTHYRSSLLTKLLTSATDVPQTPLVPASRPC